MTDPEGPRTAPHGQPGKTCMWTVDAGLGFGSWCGSTRVAAVVTVPPLRAGGRVLPGYEMTLCAEHKADYDRDQAAGGPQA